jgi:hypothetical protein
MLLPSLFRSICPCFNLSCVPSNGYGKLGIDPLLMDQFVIHGKERHNGRTRRLPFLRADLGLPGQPSVIVL